MAKTPNPVALYPGLLEFPNLAISDYPDLQSFLSAGPDWRMVHWRWGYEFLSYIGRNKSEHTFGRFRNETERFLLWVFLYKDKPMDQLRKADILEYADFCWQPPVSWIGLVNHEKFVRQAGFYHQNPQWSPFRLKLAKGSQSSEPANKKKYKPSQQTLSAMFTSVIALYK